MARLTMNMSGMRASAGEASALLKALANPHRLLLACSLLEKEQTVGTLAKLLQIRDSSVSQHLAVLRGDKLVSARRDGHLIWYSITSKPARAVIKTLHREYGSQAAKA